jgi:hypothetical protein
MPTISDHLIVLKDGSKNGRIEAEDKLEDLLSTCAERQRLWASDLGVVESLAAHVGG